MATQSVHTCLKGFIKSESFGYNMKGYFNFGDRELTDHEARLMVNYGVSKGYRCEDDIPGNEVEKILKEHENDKVLTVQIKKEWFDKIVSGEKTEEYREIKSYWVRRIFDMSRAKVGADTIALALQHDVIIDRKDMFKEHGKALTHVLFICGRNNQSPRIEKEIVSITIGKPQKGLCPDSWLNQEFFIIKFK